MISNKSIQPFELEWQEFDISDRNASLDSCGVYDGCAISLQENERDKGYVIYEIIKLKSPQSNDLQFHFENNEVKAIFIFRFPWKKKDPNVGSFYVANATNSTWIIDIYPDQTRPTEIPSQQKGVSRLILDSSKLSCFEI